MLAVQADGSEVTTIEGLADERRAAPGAAGLPRDTTASSAATARPGMVMAAVEPPRTRTRARAKQEIRDGLEGNLCRCTGYQNIVKAVQAAATA